MHLGGNRNTVFLLRHSILSTAVFVLLSVLCMVLLWNDTDQPAASNDLPKTAASVTGRETVDREFGQTEPNLRVVLYDVSVAQALAYKEEIGAVPGVSRVQWLDDEINIYEPLEMLEESRISPWYRDSDACLYITAQAGHTLDTITEIRGIIGEENRMDGPSVSGIAWRQGMDRAYLTIWAGGFLLIFLWMAMLLKGLGIVRYPLHACGCAVLYVSAGLAAGAVRAVSSAPLEMGLAANFFLLILTPIYCRNFYRKLVPVMREGGSMTNGLSAAAAKAAVWNLRPALLGTVLSVLLLAMEYRAGRGFAVQLTAAVWIGYIWICGFLPVFARLFWGRNPEELRGRKQETVQHMGGFTEKAAGVVYAGRVVLVLLTVLVAALSVLGGLKSKFRYDTNQYVNWEGDVSADQTAVERQWGKPSYITVLVPKGSEEREQALAAELRQLPGVIYLDSGTGLDGGPAREGVEDTSEYTSLHYTRFTVGIDVVIQPSAEEALRSVQNIGSRYYGTSTVYAGNFPDEADSRPVLERDTARLVLLLAAFLFITTVIEVRSAAMAAAVVLCGLGGGLVTGLAAYFMDWKPYHTGWLMGLMLTGAILRLSISVSAQAQCGSHIPAELTDRKLRRQTFVRLWMEHSFGPVLWFISEAVLAGVLLRAAAGNTAMGQMGSLTATGCVAGLLMEMILVPLWSGFKRIRHAEAAEWAAGD